MSENAFAAATERLATRLRAAEHLLRSDLANAIAAHDLTRSQLFGVETNARRQGRAGVTVTADEFWTRTAQPQAAVLLTVCRRIQDEASGAIGDAMGRHGQEVAARRPEPDEIGWWREIMEAEVHRLGPAFVPPTTINDLGHWWQTRLRRRATVLAVPGSLLKPAARFPLLVTVRELELARQPPWSHGDRLLAAFELANAELQTRAADIEHDLACRAEAVIEAVLARNPSTARVDLDPATYRPPASSKQGNGPPHGGRATGDRLTATIELP